MSKKLIALLMATLMLLSLAAACGNQLADPPKPPATTHDPPAKPADPDADKYGGDLVIANSNISTTIDPHNSQGITGNYAWMVNVYDTILSRDAAGNIFPLICDFTQSEDGKTITLTIREYYYHNGTKIKIEDVLASMERATYFSGSWADTWSKMQSKPPELSVSYVDPYGSPVELTGWSSAEGEAFVRLVDETTQTVSTDDALAGILRDELGRFFDGQQSAQSAAAAIQRRVQLYLDKLS